MFENLNMYSLNKSQVAEETTTEIIKYSKLHETKVILSKSERNSTTRIIYILTCWGKKSQNNSNQEVEKQQKRVNTMKEKDDNDKHKNVCVAVQLDLTTTPWAGTAAPAWVAPLGRPRQFPACCEWMKPLHQVVCAALPPDLGALGARNVPDWLLWHELEINQVAMTWMKVIFVLTTIQFPSLWLKLREYTELVAILDIFLPVSSQQTALCASLDLSPLSGFTFHLKQPMPCPTPLVRTCLKIKNIIG